MAFRNRIRSALKIPPDYEETPDKFEDVFSIEIDVDTVNIEYQKGDWQLPNITKISWGRTTKPQLVEWFQINTEEHITRIAFKNVVDVRVDGNEITIIGK